MILSQEARQSEIPEGVKVIRELKERVKRFEKFNREYSDYKRFRERIRKEGYSLSQGILDVRFTGQFIKKLIEEAHSLQVNKDHDDMFDESMLEGDLKVFEEWKESAEQLLTALTKDDLKFDDPLIKKKFMSLKQEMKKIPVYDKESFVKVQVFDWLFTILDMIKTKDKEEPKSIGTWESKVKQSEQFQDVMSHLKNHRIYQMLIFEVDQAKQVIEFVTIQKTHQKSLAAKFNMDKQQNYAFFRNKVTAKKIEHMLELAKQSKIDVQEEIRCLDQWLRDYEKFHQMYA